MMWALDPKSCWAVQRCSVLGVAVLIAIEAVIVSSNVCTASPSMPIHIESIEADFGQGQLRVIQTEGICIPATKQNLACAHEPVGGRFAFKLCDHTGAMDPAARSRRWPLLPWIQVNHHAPLADLARPSTPWVRTANFSPPSCVPLPPEE